MKTIKTCLVFLLIIISVAFKPFYNDLEKCLLNVGETITFSNKPACPTCRGMMNMKRGSYDGTNFEVSIDTLNNIVLKDIRPAYGAKQDEFFMNGCTGSLTLGKEELTIKLDKVRKSYYLINLDEGVLVGSFDTIKSIVLQAETESGKPAAYYCAEKDQSGVRYQKSVPKSGSLAPGEATAPSQPFPNTSIHLEAVPREIKKSEMSAEVHAPNTLAHFTKIEIELADGMKMPYPRGSYMLCEGSAIVIK